MLTDSEFVLAADRTLAAIGAALDAALDASAIDADWKINDGILEIECDDGSKLIVNRHVPNREIWVAARAGGYHFAAVGGIWRDTRSGNELGTALAELVRSQSGVDITLPPLAAPTASAG